MINNKRRLFLLLVSLIFVSGCAVHSVISRTYNFSSVRRIGVLKVSSRQSPVKGVEDMFAQYLIKEGFTVVERSKLKEIMKENKIGAEGAINPEMTKQLGKLLGVDVLLIGEITSYTPEKETTTIAESENTFIEPVYSLVKKEVDGKTIEVIEQTGTKIRKESNRTPITFTTSPQVSLIAKLVDVETAEVVWVGSITKQGSSPADAAESAVDYLVKNLGKDINSVLGKNKK
ncbi:MAG: hypothetical protein NT145_08690 [Elusimicrobia bacterium]|nr:hypothetical protein [Elusimicrobiota bacterium]